VAGPENSALIVTSRAASGPATWVLAKIGAARCGPLALVQVSPGRVDSSTTPALTGQSAGGRHPGGRVGRPHPAARPRRDTGRHLGPARAQGARPRTGSPLRTIFRTAVREMFDLDRARGSAVRDQMATGPPMFGVTLRTGPSEARGPDLASGVAIGLASVRDLARFVRRAPDPGTPRHRHCPCPARRSRPLSNSARTRSWWRVGARLRRHSQPAVRRDASW